MGIFVIRRARDVIKPFAIFQITWTCGEGTGGGPLGRPFFRRVQLLGRVGPFECRSEGPGPGPGAQVAEGQQRVLSAQLIIGHALEATRSDADHFLVAFSSVEM